MLHARVLQVAKVLRSKAVGMPDVWSGMLAHCAVAVRDLKERGLSSAVEQ